MKLKEHMKKYGQTTSLKGLSKVFKSESLCLKLLWAIAFITGLGTGLYLLITLMMKYLSYSTVGKVSTCNGCHPPFPDVTLCNVYPLGMYADYNKDNPTKIMSFKEYGSVITDLYDNTNITDISLTLGLPEDELDDMFGVLYSLSGYIENVNVFTLHSWMDSKPNYKGLVNYCNWYDWEGNSYDKENCMKSSRFYSYSAEYSLCTTIHMNDSKKMSSNHQVKGFEALLYLNRYNELFMPDYTQNLFRTQAGGVRVLIHPANTYPEISKGFNIPSGHEVEIRVNAEQVIQPPAPYSNCTETDNLFKDEYTDATVHHPKVIDYIYSESVSRALCKQDYFIKKCGCFHHMLPVPIQLKIKFPKISSCIAVNNSGNITSHTDINFVEFSTKLKCATYDIEDSVNLDDQCSRAERCSQFKYPYQVQQSLWPDVIYMLSFYCEFISTNDCSDLNSTDVSPEFTHHYDYFKELLSIEETDELEAMEMLVNIHRQENLVEKNFIQLKVLFSDPEMMIYEDIPSVTADFLFGSLGGILNLWIGMTFFTIIEWADLGVTILKDYFKKDNDITYSDNGDSNQKKEEKQNYGMFNNEITPKKILKTSGYHS